VCWKRLDQFGATHHVEIRLDTSGFDDLDGSLGVGLYSGVDLLCFNLGEERLKVVSGMDIRIRKEFVVDRHIAGLGNRPSDLFVEEQDSLYCPFD